MGSTSTCFFVFSQRLNRQTENLFRQSNGNFSTNPTFCFFFVFKTACILQQKAPSTGPGQVPRYDLPISDENAPDMYIPCMSLITYVLLCALVYGTAGKFNPEVLPEVTTRCAVTQVMEVLAIRMGFYLMECPVALLDLFSYTGYKYLGLCINMMFALVLGHFGLGYRAYYLAFFWTATAASFFMFQTMSHNIPTITASTGPKREIAVVAFSASQFASMWFLGQTKFL
jgi:protein transport protein YIF1